MRNWIGNVADKEWKNDIMDAKWLGDQIIALTFLEEQVIFNVISPYAPKVGLEKQLKVNFWEAYFRIYHKEKSVFYMRV